MSVSSKYEYRSKAHLEGTLTFIDAFASGREMHFRISSSVWARIVTDERLAFSCDASDYRIGSPQEERDERPITL